jgi:hypothetical protein
MKPDFPAQSGPKLGASSMANRPYSSLDEKQGSDQGGSKPQPSKFAPAMDDTRILTGCEWQRVSRFMCRVMAKLLPAGCGATQI